MLGLMLLITTPYIFALHDTRSACKVRQLNLIQAVPVRHVDTQQYLFQSSTGEPCAYMLVAVVQIIDCKIQSVYLMLTLSGAVINVLRRWFARRESFDYLSLGQTNADEGPDAVF
jgi:hypothetical protein